MKRPPKQLTPIQKQIHSLQLNVVLSISQQMMNRDRIKSNLNPKLSTIIEKIYI